MIYDDATQLLNDLKSLPYCCYKLIELNQKLYQIESDYLGLSSRSTIRLTPEQERSPLPMPTYQHYYVSPITNIMDKDRCVQDINKEVEYYRQRIYKCKPIELLSAPDQNMLFELYFFEIDAREVADKYGYTIRGMYKRIRGEIKKVI